MHSKTKHVHRTPKLSKAESLTQDFEVEDFEKNERQRDIYCMLCVRIKMYQVG